MQRELRQVVDENDQIIGHKSWDDFDYEKDIFRVSALWLTNSRNEVLIAQRAFIKDVDPGKWGPAVAGTLEKGESYESNIYKEAQEEIGLTGLTFTVGPKLRVYKPRNYFAQWFRAKLDRPAENFVLAKDEVETVTWISKTDLINDIKTKPDKFVPTMPKVLKNLGVI